MKQAICKEKLERYIKKRNFMKTKKLNRIRDLMFLVCFSYYNILSVFLQYIKVAAAFLKKMFKKYRYVRSRYLVDLFIFCVSVGSSKVCPSSIYGF